MKTPGSGIKSVVKNFESVLAEYLEQMFKSVGVVGVAFLALGGVALLLRNFLPSLNKDLEPLLDIYIFGKKLSPEALLSAISLSSVTIFFFMLFIVDIVRLLLKFARLIWSIIVAFVNFVAAVIVKFFYLVGADKLAASVSQVITRIEYKVYFKEKLEIGSDHYEILEIPLDDISKFHSISATVTVVDEPDIYWRCGFIFEDKNRQQYIFHIYEDPSEPHILKTRILTRTPEKEVIDKKKTVGNNTMQNIKIEVKKEKERLLMLVNGNRVNLFDVPLDNIESLCVAAWAEEHKFKIVFNDIEAVAG